MVKNRCRICWGRMNSHSSRVALETAARRRGEEVARKGKKAERQSCTQPLGWNLNWWGSWHDASHMQFPSRIRLFSLPPSPLNSSVFAGKKEKRKFWKIKILNLKEWKKEGGRNAWKVEKLEIERYYSTSKNVIYIYTCVYIYIMEWRATFLGRDWEEFLSLSPFGNAVFSYADLGRARERKRGCLSLSLCAICKWRRIAVSGRFDNGPDNYARYNGLAFTPRVRSIVKVSWPMNRGENSVAPYRRRHDIFNYRDTFLSTRSDVRAEGGRPARSFNFGKIRFRIARDGTKYRRNILIGSIVRLDDV